MNTFSIGTGLMQSSAMQAASTARNIANANTPGYQRTDIRTGDVVPNQAPAQPPLAAAPLQANRQGLPPSNVDLATEMVNLIRVQTGYELGVKLVNVADEMTQETLNIKR